MIYVTNSIWKYLFRSVMPSKIFEDWMNLVENLSIYIQIWIYFKPCRLSVERIIYHFINIWFIILRNRMLLMVITKSILIRTRLYCFNTNKDILYHYIDNGLRFTTWKYSLRKENETRFCFYGCCGSICYSTGYILLPRRLGQTRKQLWLILFNFWDDLIVVD